MYRLFHFCLILLILALICPAAVPVQAATGSGSAENALLQFTGGGHVLGFAPERADYAAAGDHALKIEFVDGSMSSLRLHPQVLPWTK